MGRFDSKTSQCVNTNISFELGELVFGNSFAAANDVQYSPIFILFPSNWKILLCVYPVYFFQSVLVVVFIPLLSV